MVVQERAVSEAGQVGMSVPEDCNCNSTATSMDRECYHEAIHEMTMEVGSLGGLMFHEGGKGREERGGKGSGR